MREIDELDNIKEVWYQVCRDLIYFTVAEPIKCHEFQAWGINRQEGDHEKAFKAECQRSGK